ncbi:MAG TPA: MFS transporter [Panacibacter sp.]|nr:MFS transporter [Panacibacter sp.]HNP44191.1 MFS transporter [Panacibacter sp.]
MSKPTTANYRYTVVALLFFATTINYLDRQVIGYLKPVLEKEFNWSETDYGHIVMAFSTAYALGLLLFGRVIDAIGTKLGYTISIIIWSIAALLHAIVRTTFGFGVVRALLGAGESGNFPAAIKTVTEWFPKNERAVATGIFNAGANIGPVVLPFLVPFLLNTYGWQSAFIVTGALGFIWLVCWITMYEIPAKHKRIAKEELLYINSDAEPVAQVEKVSWAKLFAIKQTWAFIFGKLLTDPIWWFFLFWLPSYFSSTFKLDLTKPGWPLAVIYSATTIGSIGGGYLSSWFIKRGYTPYKARKTAMLIFAFCVIPVVMAQFTTNMWVAVALISLAAASHQAWSANIYTTASDFFPKQAVSSVIGIGGMAGATGGILFPLIVGVLLDHYKALGNITAGYNILFVISGCAYLVAWLAMHFLTRNNAR